MQKLKVIFLLGPTASGKTEFSLKLAKKINAEIISCDSMQVYRGMDIISSKPALSSRRKIPHYLLDVVPPGEEFNASAYRQHALKAMRGIHRKGKIPLFVGGTGLYAGAVLDGIFEGPGEDKQIRSRLYAQAERKGGKYLYQRLIKFDPEAAVKIHAHDLKRIIRALEVYVKSGRPISQWQKERKGIAKDYDGEVYCLDRSRQELYKRINKRVEQMFRKGLVKEVQKLLKQRLSRTAFCAIGIKEIQGYLKKEYSLTEAKELIKRHTRQYAKRQLTWFRKDKRITWIRITDKKPRLSLIRRFRG